MLISRIGLVFLLHLCHIANRRSFKSGLVVCVSFLTASIRVVYACVLLAYLACVHMPVCSVKETGLRLFGALCRGGTRFGTVVHQCFPEGIEG